MKLYITIKLISLVLWINSVRAPGSSKFRPVYFWLTLKIYGGKKRPRSKVSLSKFYGPWGCPWSPKQPTDLLIRSYRSLHKYIKRFDFHLIGWGSIPNCCWWAVFCSSRACCLSLSPSSFCPSRAARCAVSDVWISCMCLVFRLLSISYKQRGKLHYIWRIMWTMFLFRWKDTV